MRDAIKQQLEQCNFANLASFDATTNTFHIPKYSKPQYKIGDYYLIKVPGIYVDNKTTTLAINWNRGTAPKFAYLKAYVSKTMGTMVYVDTLAYDYENKQDLTAMWSGWLPMEELEQIMKL